jgi:regulator of replication initiation timing
VEWFIDGETGLPAEAAEKVKRRFQEYEAEIQQLKQENQALKDENNVLKARISELEAVVRKTDTGVVISDVVIEPTRISATAPNMLVIGSPENYVADVFTGNVTIASRRGTKTSVRDVSDSELDVELPRPKKYRRDENSPEELGFVAEEMPAIIRRVGGYDLKAVVAILTYKISRLEKMLKQR